MIPGTLDRWALARPGACPHGFSLPAQSALHDCTPVAPETTRNATLTAVSDAADPDVKAALEAAIRRHAATGRVFSANQIRSEVDVTGPVVGAVFGQLSKAGVIEHVGYEHSTKANTKAHDIKQWRGAAA